MPGAAAVTIWCDVSPEVRAQFDDWHAHEHVPERLSIPGFLRASRWVAADGGAGNFMLYEAQDEAAITGGPYLERLNDPTPWSRTMMPHHRNMVRSLCRVQWRRGGGLGHNLLTLRFAADDGIERTLERTLSDLASRRGVVCAQYLRNIPSAGAPTTEQKIRGGDAAADAIVLLTGYDADVVASLRQQEFAVIAGLYRLAYVRTRDEE